MFFVFKIWLLIKLDVYYKAHCKLVSTSMRNYFLEKYKNNLTNNLIGAESNGWVKYDAKRAYKSHNAATFLVRL